MMSQQPHVAITASACYLPTQILNNRDIIERFNLDVDEAWIESRTGIHQRHWMNDEETTSDMVVAVAREILQRRNLSPNDLDRIILATISGDYPSPATATIAAQKLGTRCAAFDISAACTGFLYALDIGAGAIRNGDQRVLVVAADARSRFIDKTDRRGTVLFADGAAGILLESSAQAGLLGVFLGANGHIPTMGAWVNAGGARNPTTPETVAKGEHYLQVDTLNNIFPMFIDHVEEAISKVLKKVGLSLDDIDVFIPHQGNSHLIDRIIARLDFPAKRTINYVHRHGNTSGATIPIALVEALECGDIQPGQKVLMATFGAGNTFGAAVYQF